MRKYFFLLHQDGAVTFYEMVHEKGVAQFRALAASQGNAVVSEHEVGRETFYMRRPQGYRAAMTLDAAGKVTFDMAKAREIHRDRIRRARAQVLADLDVAFMRAVETGADTAPIAAQKQKLRDATADPHIAAAKSIDDLIKVWPL